MWIKAKARFLKKRKRKRSLPQTRFSWIRFQLRDQMFWLSRTRHLRKPRIFTASWRLSCSPILEHHMHRIYRTLSLSKLMIITHPIVIRQCSKSSLRDSRQIQIITQIFKIIISRPMKKILAHIWLSKHLTWMTPRNLIIIINCKLRKMNRLN